MLNMLIFSRASLSKWSPEPSVIPTPPRTIRLPADILDLILDALWEEGWQVSHLTLVCASWRRRIQRVQLETLKVKHLKDLRKITKRPASGELTGFGRHVRALEVDTSRFYPWTFEELLALLQALPNVTKLSLDLSVVWKSGIKLKNASLVPVDRLVNLKELTIHCDSDNLLIPTRKILAASPNLESFTLSHSGLKKPEKSWYEDATPFDMPSLTRLSLLQPNIFENLQEIRLLSDSTLLQINHLELKDLQHSIHGSAFVSAFQVALHGIDGANIKTLALRNCPPSLPQGMMMACPHVEKLIITPSAYAITLPESVNVLEYDCAGMGEDEEVNLVGNVRNWDRIEKLCVINADERILDLINRGYLEFPVQVAEIFVNGRASFHLIFAHLQTLMLIFFFQTEKHTPSTDSSQTPLPLPLPIGTPTPPSTRWTRAKKAWMLVLVVAAVAIYVLMSFINHTKKK